MSKDICIYTVMSTLFSWYKLLSKEKKPQHHANFEKHLDGEAIICDGENMVVRI